MSSLPTISDSNSDVGESIRPNRIRSALDGWSDRVRNAVHNWRWPTRERNLIAAFFTLLSLTLLSAALADDEWIYLSGGSCVLNHIGISLFYGYGTVSRRPRTEIIADEDGQDRKTIRMQTLYKEGGTTYFDCVNNVIADIFHGLMGVLFVAVATTLASFFLDTFGVRSGFLAWLRRNSIFSILTVIFCVIILGLTYWACVEIEKLQYDSVTNPDSISVSFEDGFYLVVAAAAFAVCAIVANLVKSSMQMKRRCDDRLLLLENVEREFNEAAAITAAANRENFLHNYHNYRRRMMGLSSTPPNTRTDSLLDSTPASGSNASGMVITERPIGSCGPPPPLQMILNVPPPPPYSP